MSLPASSASWRDETEDKSEGLDIAFNMGENMGKKDDPVVNKRGKILNDKKRDKEKGWKKH